MSKKIGKREARNKLFEYAADKINFAHPPSIFPELSTRDLEVIAGEQPNVAARIRKLISVSTVKEALEELVGAAGIKESKPDASPADELF